MNAKTVLRLLKEEWTGCTRCPLSGSRESARIVFGAGSTSPRFLFVYEVPTEADAYAAEPMSGDAGVVLAEVMEAAKLDHAESYCVPVVGCRPTAIIPATEAQEELVVDRAAKKEEVEACRPRLNGIIYATDPQVIFALGDLAWKVLVRPKDRGTSTTLDKAIGEPMVTYVPGKLTEICYPVIPLPSMKQIVASPSMAKHGTIGMTIRHLVKGKAYVDYLQKLEKDDLANSEES